MANEEPNKLTVLLKFLEVFELTVLNEQDGQSLVGTTRIINSQIQSLIQNVEKFDGNIREEVFMGDNYTIGQAGAVGPNSHAHDINFSQLWSQKSSEIDLLSLKEDLAILKSAMAQQAADPEHFESLAQIARAENAASEGEGAASLSYLARAGSWALGIASAIGASVAESAIGAAIGT
ncbi:hypothetical protein [Parafrankia elaeagni]|uniref:hypothetical protein n=1 Tax=Parafrankia elaeagni TaxID=222534 RepID=UPI0012B58864|nr:hypothetical protein [Parafrankia elaeagni]